MDHLSAQWAGLNPTRAFGHRLSLGPLVRGIFWLLLLMGPLPGVAQAPLALAGADRTICSGLGTTLGDNNPIPGLTYRWTPSTGLNNATIHNPRATISNTTGANIVRVYTLTVTNAAGATATDSVAVMVLPRPFIDAGFDQTICSGQTITVGSPALPGYSYAWTVDPFLSNANIAQPTYTPINPSQTSFFRDLVLIVRGPNGCDATARIRITVNPAVVAAAGPNQSSCAGQSVTLGSPAQPGYSYSWTPTTGLDNANAAQPHLTATNSGTAPVSTTYTLTVNANGCTDSSRTTVTVFPAVVAEAGPAVGACAGKPSTLASGQLAVAGTTYSWSPTTGLSNPNILNPTVTLATPGTFTYTLTATSIPVSGTTCSTSDTVAVTVDPLPVAQAAPTPGAPVVLCANEPGSLGGAPAVPGVTYQWRPATGLTAPTDAITSVALPNLTGAPLTTVYTLIATSAVGCADSSQVTVTVNPAAIANAGVDTTTCASQSLTLGAPALPGYSYSWSPATGLSSATAAQPTLTTVNPTSAPLTLTYYLTATQTGGISACSAIDSVKVIVNPTPIAPVVSGPTFVCDFNAPLTYTVANTPGATYQWTVTGGTLTAGQGTPQATVQFTPGASAYGVSAGQASAGGCPGPVASLPVVFDNPSVLLTLASVEAASNTAISFTFAAPGSANTPAAVQVLRRVAGQGTFAVVGNAPATATTYTDNGVDAAANSYEYRFELTNGCGTTVASALTQTVRLVAAVAPDQASTLLTWNAYVGFPVQEYRIYRRLDGNAAELVTTVSGSTLQATIPTSTSTTGGGFHHEFRVVAVGPADPTALLANSNTASVEFVNAVRAYNVITPDQDGRNDAFVIDNIGFYPGNSLRIFNRWGREVFKATDYQNNWGSDDSVASGVYYYLLELPTGTSTKGWVEVVK
jgi:gliding motility-associated-like protein